MLSRALVVPFRYSTLFESAHDRARNTHSDIVYYARVVDEGTHGRQKPWIVRNVDAPVEKHDFG